jgi:hypothetical protein
MKQVTFLFILTYFLGGCAREVSTYSFETADSVKIDESKLVLTRFPQGLAEINDSIAGMVNGGQKISLYNIRTGENTRNFSTRGVNFDSLVKATFQKRFEGKREYTYDSVTAGGLSDGNSQVLAFSYADNKFYIYVNALVNLKYVNDPEELKKYEEKPEIKAAIKIAGGANITVAEYLDFIFVTDSLFNLKTIIPQYKRADMQQQKYSSYLQKTFAVDNKKLYAPILQEGQTFDHMRSKIKQDEKLFILAKFDLNAPESVDYRLSYKEIDQKDISISGFFFNFFTFKNTPSGLLFSNGKEICAIETGEKIFPKNLLQQDEWISNFYRNNENDLTMVTYNLVEKDHPTEMDLAYGIDSTCNMHVKVFNKEKNNWATDMEVKTKTNPMFLVTKDKIVYIEKDKQHYYFKTIRYNEN